MSNTNRKRTSFLALIKEGFKPSKATKMFPWLQSGLLLVGFTFGILVTSAVDIISRLTPEDSVKEETSEEELCRAQGGRYDRTNDECLLVTSDSGAGCNVNDDCSGWCLAYDDAELGTEAEGFCGSSFNMEGCFKFIDEGKVNSICMPN